MPNIAQTQSSIPHDHHMHVKQRSKSLLGFNGDLKINLVEPILFMRGSPQESTGCFLRGELYLNLTKPTKFKKIEMKFIGKLKTIWPETKISYSPNSSRNELCEKSEIITHSWTFLAPIVSSNSFSATQYHLLSAGAHTYPFELFLPGDLPETIKANRGTVTYKLVANAVRQGFSPNINTTQYVHIIRTLLDGQNSEGISISSMKESLRYEINIPKRAYVLGDTIEIDVKLRPMVKNLRIIGKKIELNEESTYKARTRKHKEIKSLGSQQVRDCGEQRLSSERRGSNNESDPDGDIESNPIQISGGEDIYYHKFITFPIPKRTKSSCKSSSITVGHQLKFTFTTSELLTTGIFRRKKAEIKVEVPIVLLSCRCASDELPTYEEGEYSVDNGDGENRNLDEGYVNISSETNDQSHLERLMAELPPNYYDIH